MNGRTLAKTKNQNSTTFLPVFGKKLSGSTFTPEPANEARDVSNPNFAHNFGDVQVESPAFKQSCPLSLSGPTHCPFGSACHSCPSEIQANLTINEPGNKYEQEADRIAKQITGIGEHQVSRHAMHPVQTQSSDAPSAVHEVLSSNGQPLETETETFMQSRFNYDFSNVRIHTDTKASESAKALNAKAFTFGRSIIFGEGQYSPNSLEGRKLLAHELTHVVQQKDMTGNLIIQPKIKGTKSFVKGTHTPMVPTMRPVEGEVIKGFPVTATLCNCKEVIKNKKGEIEERIKAYKECDLKGMTMEGLKRT